MKGRLMTIIGISIFGLSGISFPETGTVMEQSLSQLFEDQAKTVLARHPGLPRDWIRDKARITLKFPKRDPGGFDVRIEADEFGLDVFYEGGHEHIGASGQPREIVRNALGSVRDLLSPHMRVRELRAGNSAYRWYLEALHDGEWHVQGETGHILWNYLGRRSERIYRNHSLPGRLDR